MPLNYQYQDNLLLLDILKRNYFSDFSSSLKEIKTLNFSFFHNDELNDCHIIPNYPSLESNNDFSIIYKNWKNVLMWYKTNNFHTEICIHDNLLINNLEQFDKIISQIFELDISYINLKIYIDWHKLINIPDLLNYIIKLNNKSKIDFIFNIPIDKIHEILQYKVYDIGKINLLIPPGLTGNQLIEIQKIININQLKINEYIEIDSDEWHYTNIQEYLTYIDFLLKSNIEDILNPNSLIGINDKHIIDNQNCKKSCNFQKSLNILIANLSINLCHKFQYDDQIVGFMEFDDNINLSIKAKNLPLIILNTHLKRSSTPHCETCPYVAICRGFCFARSYRKCFNPIIPIKESCDLKKAKFTYIFNYVKNNNYENILLNNENSEIFKNYLKLVLNNNGGLL